MLLPPFIEPTTEFGSARTVTAVVEHALHVLISAYDMRRIAMRVAASRNELHNDAASAVKLDRVDVCHR